MDRVSRVDLMADRIIDLSGIPVDFIRQQGFDYMLEDDYLVAEALVLDPGEVLDFKMASASIYRLFASTLDQMIESKQWGWIDLPPAMIDLIEFSWLNEHRHLLGRFDLAGGIAGADIKLLEYNADTPTMIPESSSVQQAFAAYGPNHLTQFNHLEEDLERAFDALADENSSSHHSMLFTSLGYEEDKDNLSIIMNAAERAGFDVAYADLEHVIFDEDEGVFLQYGDEYVQYDYLYKMVPWEFIVYEEPELLDILHQLVTNDKLYILNPAYTLIFQSKAFMEQVWLLNNSDYLLKTTSSPKNFEGQPHVRKVVFGRLGENIAVVNDRGEVVEATDGDFGDFPTIYQAFTRLYTDEDGDIYQAGIYTVDRRPSCISFRRRDSLIIDDDAEFVPHLIEQND